MPESEAPPRYHWETFRRPRGPYANPEPRATLNRWWTLSLNRPAHALAGEPSHYVLSYAQNSGQIGLRPATATDRGACKITRNSSRHVLGVRAFMAWAGIPRPDMTQRYVVTRDGDTLVLTAEQQDGT